MTVSYNDITRATFAGNGTTTAFNLDVPVQAADDVIVYSIQDSDGAKTLQVLNTDYTVAIDATTARPTVTFTTAPASGFTILIYVDFSGGQPDDLSNSNTNFASNQEDALDRLAKDVIALKDELAVVLRMPRSVPAVNALGDIEAGKGAILGFNSSTGQPEYTAISTLQASLGALDADLAAIGALTPANDDIIQRKASAWVNRTMTQLMADAGLVLNDDLTFAADPDTRIRRVAADTVVIETNGVERFRIDESGNLTLPTVPAFMARMATGPTNVTGNGTAYTVIFDTEVHDRNADFNLGTSVFTAPVTGLYDFSAAVDLLNIGTTTSALLELVTTAGVYRLAFHAGADDVSGRFTLAGSVTGADMAATNTASLRITLSGAGGDTVDIGGGTDRRTFFSGRLVA